MEIREESNEVQDLPARTFGFLEGKESEGRCEVSKVLPDVWHEAGYLEMIYPKLLEVCECGKITEVVSAKLLRSKLSGGIAAVADTESLDEWKQPKLV